jgi:hypothetical protein
VKIEHKLSPAVSVYTQRALQQLQQARNQYLIALGQAKEAEIQSAVIRQALEQQLALIEQSEHLPPSVNGYALSPDGAMLIGETERAESPERALAVNGNG